MYTFKDKQAIAMFISQNLVSSAVAAEMLDCSRANISDLVKRGKLLPAVSLSQTLLFWKDDIEDRKTRSPKPGRPATKPASN